ncbi:hypothetical protein Acr_24g0006490 [Actinidia rufa]|uniref:Uncharacterized protein n=1 Tax=Actinidia rufa TaxID=165716 RepID=A0A7J0GUF1_9ERIC|nr:hypothetical protein Acr_24g0006490 [Actinidia rufa]
MHLMDLPGRAPIPHQPDVEGGDGTLSPNLHARSSSTARHLQSGEVRDKLSTRWPIILVQGRGEGITSSSSIYTSPDSLDSEEKEKKEDFNQLVLNKNHDWVILAVEPALLIFISSSNNEHLGNLAHNPLQSVGEVEIVPSFREPNDSDDNSGEAYTMRFRNLRKRAMPSIDLSFVIVPPVNQVSEQTVDLIVELTKVIMGVDPDSSEAPLASKCKRKELTKDTSRRTKKRAREISSGASIELWKPEFSVASSSLHRAIVFSDYMREQLKSELNKAKLELAAINQPNKFGCC